MLLCCLSAAIEGRAVENVRLLRGDKELTVSGELVIEAEDGGLVVLAADGTLWKIEPSEVKERSSDDQPFAALTRDALGRQMLAELPSGFEFHTTARYVICYNTSPEYAQWCGALFERLHMAFRNYWSRRGFELEDPRFPLVAVIFADATGFRNYAREELGEAAEGVIGYYSLRSNRMTMYDLTGIAALRGRGTGRGSAAQINQLLSRPEAERTVATVIHEATHQIAFNCGMHQRFADVPLWLLEGLAMFFETPDLKSAKGWRTLGALNRVRLDGMKEFLPRRQAKSLESLIYTDQRFRESKIAEDAYAESWSLVYYLNKQRPKQFDAYLKLMQAKRPYEPDDDDTRLADFQAAFGTTPLELEAEFIRAVKRMK